MFISKVNSLRQIIFRKSGTARYLGMSSYHVDNRTLREGSIDIDVAVDKPPRFNVMGVDMTANFED